MSLVTGPALARRQAALYTPAAERVDCCRRCTHSKPVCDGMRCNLHKTNVGALGVCAFWRPVQRWVIVAEP